MSNFEAHLICLTQFKVHLALPTVPMDWEGDGERRKRKKKTIGPRGWGLNGLCRKNKHLSFL